MEVENEATVTLVSTVVLLVVVVVAVSLRSLEAGVLVVVGVGANLLPLLPLIYSLFTDQ